ncbi:META domain-containing protein [Pendulispora albinea]|uniref:META domain-containing protein n=1 Tax=Pendulispora albinea TaxID=2741071 RepID=A0ABZ2LRJ5_9BACT
MARLRLRLLGIGWLLTTTSLLGCGNSAASPWGRDFLSTQVLEAGRPRPLARDEPIRLEFRENHELRVRAGCNHMFETARIQGTQLVWPADRTDQHAGIGTTLIACHPDYAAQEDWVGKLLQAKPTIVLRGNELVITHGTTEIHLLDRKVADPDRPLVGTRWTIESEISGRGPEASVGSVPDHGAYVVFTADHRFTGFSGCNGFSGKFAQPAPGKLEFSSFSITEKACDDDTGRLERTITDVFRDAASLRIDATAAQIESSRGHGVGLRAP